MELTITIVGIVVSALLTIFIFLFRNIKGDIKEIKDTITVNEQNRKNDFQHLTSRIDYVFRMDRSSLIVAKNSHSMLKEIYTKLGEKEKIL